MDPLTPVPTIVLSTSDGKPQNDCTEVNVPMDGHKMILDSGEVNISLALSIALSLLLRLQCCLSRSAEKYFLEVFVLKLETLTTTAPIAVQRVANALNVS
ncbi:hypothetical protein EXN66_Car013830 [Channa argus]|uniref:Uncharacterized protein n=1 Tax=Channa argus TaxID=215402 RepID=A0A6G1Q6U4_CHAAH|nr:hypothetical protein EXN66_Car013830 [Channa argus]